MLTRDHTVLPATHMFISQVEWAMPVITSQPQSITALWPVPNCRPTAWWNQQMYVKTVRDKLQLKFKEKKKERKGIAILLTNTT